MRAFVRSARLIITVAATGMTLTGVAGAALGWGSAGQPTASAGASSTSGHAATTRPASSSTTPASPKPSAPGEDPSTFFTSFAKAVRTGDVAFLSDRLGPAVIARYGNAHRQDCASRLVDPTEDLRLIGVSGPESFVYRSDGVSTSVSDVYVFHVTGTAAGHSGPRDYHFALVNGRFDVFVACGSALTNS